MNLNLGLLQEYKRPIPWRTMGFAFLLGVLVAAAGAMFFFRLGGLGGSGPDAPEIVVNPDPITAAGADAVIQVDETGHLSGEIQLSRRPPDPPPAPPAAPIIPETDPAPDGQEEPGNHPARIEIVPQEATSRAIPPPCPGGLHSGDAVNVPVSGSIHTTYTDSRTGRTVGEGDHPVAGLAAVEITDDYRLRVDITFSDSMEFAIDLPDPPRWWAGLIAQGSIRDGLQAGGFIDYRREIWQFRRCAVTVGGGLEVYPDWRDPSKTDLEVEVRAGLAW